MTNQAANQVALDLGTTAAAVPEVAPVPREIRPRVYAAEIIGLSTRAQRVEALSKVPEHLRAAVRRHVEQHFAMCQHRARLVETKARALSILPSWKQNDLLDAMRPWLRDLVKARLDEISAERDT